MCWTCTDLLARVNVKLSSYVTMPSLYRSLTCFTCFDTLSACRFANSAFYSLPLIYLLCHSYRFLSTECLVLFCIYYYSVYRHQMRKHFERVPTIEVLLTNKMKHFADRVFVCSLFKCFCFSSSFHRFLQYSRWQILFHLILNEKYTDVLSQIHCCFLFSNPEIIYFLLIQSNFIRNKISMLLKHICFRKLNKWHLIVRECVTNMDDEFLSSAPQACHNKIKWKQCARISHRDHWTIHSNESPEMGLEEPIKNKFPSKEIIYFIRKSFCFCFKLIDKLISRLGRFSTITCILWNLRTLN